MRRLIPILQYIIDNIDYSVCFNSITEEDGVYTVTTCDTFYITEKTKFTEGVGTYKVTEFVLNESFKFVSTNNTPFPDVNCITLDKLGFHSGTLVDAKGERGSRLNMNRQVTPFIWN